MRSVQVSKPKGPLEIVEKDIPPEKQREERWRRLEEYVEGISKAHKTEPNRLNRLRQK